MLKPKNKNSCQQQQTTIAGLVGEIIELMQDISGHLKTIETLSSGASDKPESGLSDRPTNDQVAEDFKGVRT